MTLPFTMQKDPNGRYHVLIDGVAQSGYATEREGQLWEAYQEIEQTENLRAGRVQFLERELFRLREENAGQESSGRGIARR